MPMIYRLFATTEAIVQGILYDRYMSPIATEAFASANATRPGRMDKQQAKACNQPQQGSCR